MATDYRFAVDAQPSTPAHYRRGWTPTPDVALAGMWIGAVVDDAAGETYFGLRGADDFLCGMTHVVSPVTGFKQLPPSLNPDPPHLFAEYATIDWFEPMTYTEQSGTTTLTYDSGRIERDAQGLHWYDASGRWEMHGKNISDVFTVHVPEQVGIDHQAYYRHEILAAEGVVEGIAVSGYLHQDFAYGPTGMVYPELPIARQLQGMWVSWVHQYEDGEWGGGCFWQGRDGLEFGPGYQVTDSVTTVRNDIAAKPTFNDVGQLITLEASIGPDTYEFTFDTMGSYIHFFGRMTGSSSGRLPARSWCWVEHAGPMLTPEVLDLVMARFDLARGKVT